MWGKFNLKCAYVCNGVLCLFFDLPSVFGSTQFSDIFPHEFLQPRFSLNQFRMRCEIAKQKYGASGKIQILFRPHIPWMIALARSLARSLAACSLSK